MPVSPGGRSCTSPARNCCAAWDAARRRSRPTRRPSRWNRPPRNAPTWPAACASGSRQSLRGRRAAWQGRPVTKFEVRAATEADLDSIAAVAIATGQVEEWSGSDPAYMTHLLAEGQVMVAEGADGVTGFGATRRIGDGPGAVTMLCDLFVDPKFHGLGIGQALLAALWEPGSARMTFSSLHAH